MFDLRTGYDTRLIIIIVSDIFVVYTRQNLETQNTGLKQRSGQKHRWRYVTWADF